MTRYRITLLGQFCVWRDETLLPESLWRNRKVRHLFQLLVLSNNRRLPKEQVLDLLWPHLSPSAASNNLYGALHTLRQQLGDAIALTDGVVRLDLPADSQVDVERFLQLAEQALASRSEQALSAALAAYAGPLLPDDPYEEWTVTLQERLTPLRQRLLHACAEVLALQGRDDEALATLQLALEADPFDEPAVQRLMLLQARAGRRTEALACFTRLRQALSAELDLEPLPETLRLDEALRRSRLAELPLREWGMNAFAPRRSSQPLPFARSQRPLVGQTDLLAALSGAWQSALNSRGRAVLLRGEAGAGKTRVAHEILARAHAQGALVLVGAGQSLEPRPAYGPLAEALAPLLPQLSAEYESLDALACLALRFLRGEGLPATAHEQLPLGLTRLISYLAQVTPLALLLDDLHWADPATLALLPLLARNLATQPALLIATWRPVELQPGQALGASLQQLQRAGASVLDVAPLDHSAAEQLLRQLGNEQPIEPPLASALYARSAGNPLYLIEMTGQLLARCPRGPAGDWRNELMALPLPGMLIESVRHQLAGLSPEARTVIELAALLGAPIELAELLSSSKLQPERLLDALDQAVRAALLVDGPDGLRFTHPLVQEAIQASLSSPRRIALQQLLAAPLQQPRVGRTSATARHKAKAGSLSSA